MSDPGRPAPRLALSEANAALAIVHAQYWRALARATTGEPADRAGAFAEARRLLAVAVALRGRENSQDATRARNPAPAKSSENATGGTMRPRGSYEHISV